MEAKIVKNNLTAYEAHQLAKYGNILTEQDKDDLEHWHYEQERQERDWLESQAEQQLQQQ